MIVVPTAAIIDYPGTDVGIQRNDARMPLRQAGKGSGGLTPEHAESPAMQDVRTLPETAHLDRGEHRVGGPLPLETEPQPGGVFNHGPGGGFRSSLAGSDIHPVVSQECPDRLPVGICGDTAHKGGRYPQTGAGDGDIHGASARRRVRHQVHQGLTATNDHIPPTNRLT